MDTLCLSLTHDSLRQLLSLLPQNVMLMLSRVSKKMRKVICDDCNADLNLLYCGPDTQNISHLEGFEMMRDTLLGATGLFSHAKFRITDFSPSWNTGYATSFCTVHRFGKCVCWPQHKATHAQLNELIRLAEKGPDFFVHKKDIPKRLEYHFTLFYHLDKDNSHTAWLKITGESEKVRQL
jgi:hypothetical protein